MVPVQERAPSPHSATRGALMAATENETAAAGIDLALPQVSAWTGLIRAVYVAALMACDAAAVTAAFVVAYQLRALLGRTSELSPLEDYDPTLVLLIGS